MDYSSKIWPHSIKNSIALGLLLRDYLGFADNISEVKRIISNGEVLVDGIKVKDYQYPCGLMDVISFPKMKKDYRIVFNRNGKLTIISISSKEAAWKLCRIQDKTIVKGKNVQLNLHDGRNKIVKKDEYKTGDVLRIDFKDKKIAENYKFEKGTISMIIGGSHIGEIATIEEIEEIQSSKPNLVKMKGKSDFSTLQQYIFPIGKTSPVIQIPEVKMK